MMPAPTLSVVIPCYNEEPNLSEMYRRLSVVLQDIALSYEVIFVDDGSSDGTFEAIRQLHDRDVYVRGIQLSRNFGHQVALAAGLHASRGAMVVSMDGDLQHPPELIPELIRYCEKGFDIVNTQRLDTEGAKFLKRKTSTLFYRIMNNLSEVALTEGAADFRLMSRAAVEAYCVLEERDRFNRGLVQWMGFSQAVVSYRAEARYAGETKYSLKKMFRFAVDGITSFSSKPLRIAAYVGGGISLIGLLYALYALIIYFLDGTTEGWTSLLITVLLLGGVQLIFLGIIGEYIARIFNEAKSRPLYFIKGEIGGDLEQ
ncbi:MAG: glycosyltransferase [Bacteroidetes bacterium]|nr:MAG: glycosyltransferase [Bacteroidota bacterium]